MVKGSAVFAGKRMIWFVDGVRNRIVRWELSSHVFEKYNELVALSIESAAAVSYRLENND